MQPVDEDDISLSSASSSSSSEGSVSSAEDTDKDPTDDGLDNCWRHSVFASICVLGAVVIFTTVILMLREDTDHFLVAVSEPSSVSGLSFCLKSVCLPINF